MPIAKEKELIEEFSETTPKYLTSALVAFRPAADLSLSVRDYLTKSREVLFEKIDQGFSPRRLVRLQSLMMDRLIKTLYARVFSESKNSASVATSLALFALGGYGREELNLFSDIDLLFLYEGKSPSQLEHVVKNMLYPLWDAKLEVGYAARTLKTCAKVMQEDIRAMSSMLDARFLAGDRRLGEKFLGFLERKIHSPRTLKQFIQGKLEETRNRLKRFGGSVYVIEPNLKESEGGLRDWHTLRYFARISLKTPEMEKWVRRGFITNEEADQIDRSLDFIWDVRNRLHRKAGRNQDQLLFQFQGPLAQELGFQDDASSLGAEKFMKTYYGHAADLLRLREEVTRRILKPPTSPLQRIKSRFRKSLNDFFVIVDGRVYPKSYEKLEIHPEEIMRGFWFAQSKKLVLDEDYKIWIRRNLHLIDENYRSNAKVCEWLREMFADMAGIGRTLEEMSDCRFLGVLIPEFGEILFQTQHDIYHVYTVDTHSIMAVNNLSRLQNGEFDGEFPEYKKVLAGVKSPASLVLGVLFHDIGKGRGGSHSQKGAHLAQTIMQRMGYEKPERDLVEFLVLSHLIMPQLSQRRDLDDSNLISQFARTMENLERLDLLLLLTWADIRAVGPEVWTPWKGSLLHELYQKTQEVLEKGEFNTEKAAVMRKQVRKETLNLATAAIDRRGLEQYLNIMPARYFLVSKPQKILEHYQLISANQSSTLVFHYQAVPEAHYHNLLIHTLSNPRLFEQVTGVMAENQVDILALEQFFDSKGEAMILLRVTDHRGKLIEEERKFEKLRQDLISLLEGKTTLENYSQRQTANSLLGKKQAEKPPRVEIDNDVSPYYTVIDIFANNRVGLLNDIARVMARLNLFVEVSKISTKVDQVADVFYVKDIFGHKITEKQKVQTIKDSLLTALGQES